jgi:hypothetical protein
MVSDDENRLDLIRKGIQDQAIFIAFQKTLAAVVFKPETSWYGALTVTCFGRFLPRLEVADYCYSSTNSRSCIPTALSSFFGTVFLIVF